MHRPATGAIIVGLLPFLAMCFSVSWWDSIEPVVLGLPFNIFWLCLWVLLTPLCMFWAYTIEKSNMKEDSHE